MAVQTFYADGTVTTEWEAIEVVQPRTLAAIDAIRDARIEGGFTFRHGTASWPVQSRASDRENIATLGMIASSAIAAGASPGDLNWLDPQNGFFFIMADNQVVPMDAYMMASLFQQGLGFKSSTTFFARSLKDQVLACETDQEITAIDLTTGWPGS